MRFRVGQLLAVTGLTAACLGATRYARWADLSADQSWWIVVLLLPAVAFMPLYGRNVIRVWSKRRKGRRGRADEFAR